MLIETTSAQNDNSEALPVESRKVSRAIEIRDIRSADWTKFGVKHEGHADMGHNVTVVPGESITLHGVERSKMAMGADGRYYHPADGIPYSITFRVGDVAEYDSFNLSYTGKILAIGEKTVTICAEMTGNRGAKSRLSLYDFSRKNRDFNLAEISKRNSEWTD